MWLWRRNNLQWAKRAQFYWKIHLIRHKKLHIHLSEKWVKQNLILALVRLLAKIEVRLYLLTQSKEKCLKTVYWSHCLILSKQMIYTLLDQRSCRRRKSNLAAKNLKIIFLKFQKIILQSFPDICRKACSTWRELIWQRKL